MGETYEMRTEGLLRIFVVVIVVVVIVIVIVVIVVVATTTSAVVVVATLSLSLGVLEVLKATELASVQCVLCCVVLRSC